MSGLDYRAIGLAQGARDAGAIYGRTIDRWAAHAETLERRLARQSAEHDAHDAGRSAQLETLRRALSAVAPFDPALAPTGRFYECGTPERVYEREYASAYDDVGRRHGLARSRGAMTAEEWADAREQDVLSEPIQVSWCLWWRRYHWRGVEYRSMAGAERSRADAARRAREVSGTRAASR